MNNGGWGLRIMIFWMGVMIIALIISSIIINNMGNQLFNPVNNSNKYPQNNNTYDYDVTVEKETYSNLETKMEAASIKYINDNYTDLPVGDNIQVPVKVLVGKGYLESLYDIKDKAKNCSGYIDVRHKEAGFSYVPYLKCGKNYTTKGYIERLDS